MDLDLLTKLDSKRWLNTLLMIMYLHRERLHIPWKYINTCWVLSPHSDLDSYITILLLFNSNTVKSELFTLKSCELGSKDAVNCLTNPFEIAEMQMSKSQI